MKIFDLTKNDRKAKADKLLYTYECLMWQAESHIDNANKKKFSDNEQELLNAYLDLIHASEITLRKMRKLVK